MYAIRSYYAAVAGTNDGLRPTFVVMDETHEWTGSKQRVAMGEAKVESIASRAPAAWAMRATAA